MTAATRHLAFDSAATADRLSGGVALAARAARQARDAGTTAIVIHIGDGKAVATRTTNDLARACPDIDIFFGTAPDATLDAASAACPPPAVFHWHEPSVADIVRSTSKTSDGPISRHINRPISQAVSRWLLLHVPGIRPMHVTLFVAGLGVVMLATMLWGGWAGFIIGGPLFQLASILDGVDGELARATWRSSRGGAIADSVTDQAINLAFFVGFTVGVDNYYGEDAQEAAGWAVALFIAGLMIMLTLARLTQSGGSLNFLKDWYRSRFPHGPARSVTEAMIVCTSRDCIAFAFAIALIFGLAGAMAYMLLALAVIWLFLVLWATPALLQQGPALANAELPADLSSVEVEIAATRLPEKGSNIDIVK